MELKPCPFCGGRPTLGVSQESGVVEMYEIICTNCPVELKGFDRDFLIVTWQERILSDQEGNIWVKN